MKLLRRLLLGLALLLFLAASASAQWATQTLPLRPGWNSVFLEVHPQPAECDVILAGLPVESVWAWNKRFSAVQFIQDPNTLIPAQPDWLTWIPTNHPMASQINLFILQGGKSYLIKLATNAAPINLVLHGYPNVRKPEWLTDSFNLAGFSLDPASPPTFRTFFSPSSALGNSTVYRLLTSGYWTNIPNTSLMQSGEGFWIKCNGASDFAGPMNLSLPQRDGLDYGRTLVEQTLTINSHFGGNFG